MEQSRKEKVQSNSKFKQGVFGKNIFNVHVYYGHFTTIRLTYILTALLEIVNKI